MDIPQRPIHDSTPFDVILARYRLPSRFEPRVWQYQLPGGFGYQLDAIIPAMRGDTRLERMLSELAASALESQAAIFVLIENDTFDSNTWEVTGPKSREWIALENWFVSLGWMKLGETQAGIANLMGVDCRNHYYHPAAAPRPVSD